MPTRDVLISQKFNNYNYAPGIATYGVDGKTGITGNDGNNIYFTDCDLINDTDNKNLKTDNKLCKIIYVKNVYEHPDILVKNNLEQIKTYFGLL